MTPTYFLHLQSSQIYVLLHCFRVWLCISCSESVCNNSIVSTLVCVTWAPCSLCCCCPLSSLSSTSVVSDSLWRDSVCMSYVPFTAYPADCWVMFSRFVMVFSFSARIHNFAFSNTGIKNVPLWMNFSRTFWDVTPKTSLSWFISSSSVNEQSFDDIVKRVSKSQTMDVYLNDAIELVSGEHLQLDVLFKLLILAV